MSTETQKSIRLNLGQVFKRHWLKILLAGVGTFLLLAPLAVLSNKKSYTAIVEIRIDPQYSTMIPGNEYATSIGPYYDQYVATQKFKILKRTNLEKALNALDPRYLPMFVPDGLITDAALENLANRIVVVPPQNSLILSLVMSGGQPEGLADFLNNLVNSYLLTIREEKAAQEASRFEFSDKQRVSLEAQIAAYEAEIKKISEEAATGNFNSEDIPYKIEMRVQGETTLKAENDRILKEKQYNEFVKQMDKVAKEGVESKVEESLRTDAFLAEQRRIQLGRLEELNKTLGSLTPENTSRADVEAAITAQKASLQQLENAAREKYRRLVEAEISADLEKQRLNLNREYLVAKAYEDSVKRSLDTISNKYSAISKRILIAKGLQEDLANLKQQLAKINSNLNYIQGEQQSSGRITVENYAEKPSSPDKSTLSKTLLMILAGSFAWILFVILVWEVLDTKIKSAEELRSFTGLKPSWPISHYKGDFLNLSVADPRSPINTAIKSLAIRINQARQTAGKEGGWLVPFCAVNANTGASEIILNCAHNMTENCEKVLVVDLNRERPALAAKLGFDPASLPAAAELLKKKPSSLVRSDPKRGFDLLALRDPEALDNKTLDRFLELARKEYEVIFADVTPVLQSSNTEHVITRADSVIFVVRGRHSTFGDLRHSMELAEKFGVESAGLCLNWYKPDPKAQKGGKAEKKRSDPKPDGGQV